MQTLHSAQTTPVFNHLKHFYVQNYLGLTLTGLALVWLYPQFHLDQTLIAHFFNETSQTFPLKDHFFYKLLMHDLLKNALIFIALSTLLVGLFGHYVQYLRQRIRPYQKKLIWVFICMVLACIEIAYLKSISVHGCPNDLALYGGKLPLLTLFVTLPPNIQPGHCFPGGHASAGFSLIAFYFTFRISAPTFAKTMLWLSITLGFVMGWTQMMRGEHFLSHNLWTGWFVWMTVFSLNYFYTFFNQKAL